MIQEGITKLMLLGRMPDESEDKLSSKQIEEYANLLEKIKTPINIEEGYILIKLFPEHSLFGIEWTLLHLIESIYAHTEILTYKNLIEECNSVEWKEILLKRLTNKR
jgi:hypothetical protein